jgi:hypothetical protein
LCSSLEMWLSDDLTGWSYGCGTLNRRGASIGGKATRDMRLRILFTHPSSRSGGLALSWPPASTRGTPYSASAHSDCIELTGSYLSRRGAGAVAGISYNSQLVCPCRTSVHWKLRRSGHTMCGAFNTYLVGTQERTS